MDAEEGFVSFVCNACRQEIEAARQHIGETVECPACGHPLKVPSPEDAPTPAQLAAMKGRTIRIELGGIL
ncbi:MAG: hypothetical protein IJ802_06250 [Kiritimatiellae bacterium]|nr:hypothetical protein [Kiritimatiellia bacterium]